MTTVHHASILTGGTVGSLDSKAISTLTDGDLCLVATTSWGLYWYQFDADATDAELSPDVIRPDDYVSAGVWKLLQPSINTSICSRKDIVGGTLWQTRTESLADHLHGGPVECWDSTGTVFMQITGANNLMYVSGTASPEVYLVYVVRKISGGTFGYKLKAVSNPIEDDSTIDAYRLIDFWPVIAVGELAVGYSNGGYHIFGKASEAILSSGIGATYAVVNHSVLLPEDMIAAIEYGCKDAATAGSIIATDDGTNTAFTVGLTITSATDTTATAWGDTTSNRQGLVPFNPDRKFKSSTGTLDLLVHQVVLKR